MNLFTSKPKQEAKPVAVRPRMSEAHLKNIRLAVRANPLAGKGIYSLEQLENDAIIATWNEIVDFDKIEAEQAKAAASAPDAGLPQLKAVGK